MHSSLDSLPFDPRPRTIPTRTAVISAAGLAVPLAAEVFFPEQAADYHVLLWLLALVPAFLLAYHSGWKGAATALAAGMAVLTLAQIVTILNGESVDNWPLLLSVVAAYIVVSLGIGFVSEQLHRQRSVAERMAYSDELTGIPNRRFASIFLEKEFSAAQRGRELAVVLFDIDHFKEYNDRHGHPAADEALRVFAGILHDRTRRSNLSARYGGEEFLSILSDCTAEGAIHFVNQIRQQLWTATARNPFTVSAGIAAWEASLKHPDDLLRAADRALYAAKAAGRNAVHVAGIQPTTPQENDPSGVPATG